MRTLKYLSLFGLFFLTDFLLKYWIYHHLSAPLTLLQTPFGIEFHLECVTNRGGAWGMLSSYYTPLLLFRIGIILFLTVQFIFKKAHLY